MNENNNELPPPKKPLDLSSGIKDSNNKNTSPINIPPLRDVAEEEENKRNLFKNKISGLIIGVTISFALMGVSFWWGLEIGRNSISQNNIQIPIITADKNPIKVIPENPGGMDIPHKDILVLDNAKNSEIIENDQVVLIPEPEKPILSKNNDEYINNDINNDKISLDKSLKESEINIVEKNNLFDENLIESKSKDKNNEILKKLPKSVEVEKIEDKNLKLQKENINNSNEIKSKLKLNPTPTPAPTNNVAIKKNIKFFNVQIASYRKKESAMNGWIKISKKYSSHFNNLEPIIKRVNIPNKGVFFRLQTGKFLNNKDAQDFCNKLKNLKLNCLIVIN